jgi:hypothetical protein
VSASSAITTSFGYDADGDQTRYTDGDENPWQCTYNSWGLQESRVEPPTSQYTSAGDSTFTTAYDADGDQRVVHLRRPRSSPDRDGVGGLRQLLLHRGRAGRLGRRHGRHHVLLLRQRGAAVVAVRPAHRHHPDLLLQP